MIPLLGLACVARTTYKIVGLLPAPVAATTGESAEGPPRMRAQRPGKRQFSAWDDSGRSIDVEDLGIR